MVCRVAMPALRHEASALTPLLNSRIRNPNRTFSNSRRRKPENLENLNNRYHRNHRSGSRAMVAKLPGRNFVMGEVKILKRGETTEKFVTNRCVSKENRKHADFILGSTDRLGPDLKILQKQIRFGVDEIYAGSAFSANSPPPSSVPVPDFLGKRSNSTATTYLRRLLRLELV
ncbi:uncharacterized protein LOC126656919 [Mercurialis annua]|uniref:uncharacterized protein LOC126656919 n=1 Tax=Mercurialis annua TaxID=3986 RepID=UPI00215EFB4F|nr:uncharacterized protein LOC126656919 [Mercurialis annua]